MRTTGTPDARAIDREIASLAVPAALALATDPLYDLCDTAILGRLGTAELAGASIALRLLAFGYAAFVFLMFATTAAVARHHGAGRDRDATQQAVNAVWIALVLGVAAAAVFRLSGRTMIGWLGGTGEAADHAWTYLRVSLAGLPAFTTVMVGVGFRRGSHDTRTPLRVAALTVALNLALEVTLIFGFGFGVGASALGTVIAKWTGAGIYLALIGRSVAAVDGTWRPEWASMRGQLVVGGDLVARTVILLGVIAVAQSAAARLGVDELAAYAITFQLWMFAAYAVDGLEAAGQTLVAHRLGAGRTDEVALVVRRLLWWGAIIGITFGVVLFVTAGVSPRLFSGDTTVVALASSAVVWVAVLQPVNAVAFVLDGILVGAARQRYLAVVMFGAATLFGVALAATRTTTWGLSGVWAAVSVFMLARTAGGLARVRHALRGQSF